MTEWSDWSKPITLPQSFPLYNQMKYGDNTVNSANSQIIKKIKELATSKLRKIVGGIQTANILVLGPIGAGKSSFVNGVKSAFEGKYCELLNVRDSSERVTTCIQKVYVEQSREIKLWDSFGWGDEHFRTSLDLLLTGRVQDGFVVG